MAKIVGFRKVDYLSKKTGKQVTGYSFFLTEPNSEVIGQSTFDVFLNESAAQSILSQFEALTDLIGVEVEPKYNRFGRLIEFSFVE